MKNSNSTKNSCSDCGGSGWIWIDDNTVKPSKCREEMLINNKVKFANIPEAFKDIRLSSFRTGYYQDKDSINQIVDSIKEYLNNYNGFMTKKILTIIDTNKERLANIDKRIDFAGGIRGLEYLEQRCREDMVAAIAMYPTSLDDLMSVADSGAVMPPKSTWFEPKLRSGILIHKI